MKFDYVIVGGGSAGCVMAARLSEDPGISVCLIEAGGSGRDLFIRAPALVAGMISGRPKINNWAFRTVPQPGLNGRRGFQPRGKALGGSSAINAMLYVRGHPSDYDEWADLGCDGWDWQSVLPYFKRAEGNARGADDLHGADGPLQVANQSEPRPITHAFVEAASQQQIRETQDFNGSEQEGVGLYQVTQFHSGPQKGERCSAAAAYLFPAMTRPNLTILTKTQVRRVRWDGLRATGVEIQQNGKRQIIEAKREVILSAGAFGSPQLLMLSGIGPRDELARHKIEVVHELPGVGQNLQDHLDYILTYHSKRDDVVGLGPKGLAQLAQAGLRWRKDGAGLFASPFAEGGAFFKSAPHVAKPDLQLHFVVGIVDDHMRKIHFRYGFSCHVCVLRPFSRGSVGLTSSRADKPPRIDPQYLSDPRDLQLLMTGARQMEAILEAEPLAPWRGKRLYLHDGSDAALEADIRNRADTIYHPVGTCAMGTGDMAVTDAQGRVHGVEGLRVVDASLMPRLIGGNTNAPVMMMAEKIADQMRGRMAAQHAA
ncbi:GMC family oxidoreductase [Aestuariivita boseongensis]|uniref:GMC family oxidoreductase n=1 Tax=Aestuariivita boseongensis TaxID=1470562 RepID=UPI00068157B7|nr:FAD-dependent oxidoreductase [Aestuariivita boseongensis]